MLNLFDKYTIFELVGFFIPIFHRNELKLKLVATNRIDTRTLWLLNKCRLEYLIIMNYIR